MIVINDKGIILSTSHFGESYLLVECFLEQHGIVKGLYRISKKQNSSCIAGNIVEACWKSRLIEQLGYYSFEVISNVAASISFDKVKVPLIQSVLSMISLILNEREAEQRIYNLAELILESASTDKSNDILIKMYIDLEIELLNISGFGLDLKECVVSKTKNDLVYISPKSGCAVSEAIGVKYHTKLLTLPTYMLQRSGIPSIDEAIACLAVTGFFIEKNILIPFNKKFSGARERLLKKLKFSFIAD